MTRRWKLIVPAAMGLALASSMLVAPPAQAAPVLAPAVAPAALPLASLGAVNIDNKATIEVNPVAFGATGGAQVKFSKANVVKKRPVELQASWDGLNWSKVTKGKMDKKGVVTFKSTPLNGAIYRAVAEPYKKKAEVATKSVTSLSITRDYQFDGSAVDGEWSHRAQGFDAYGRNCASPLDTNSSWGNGFATLKLSRGNASDVASAKAAGCNTKKYSVYRNAMISTQDRFTVKSGIMAARVKFPLTRGLHNGVWLRSATSEIDMVEAYGYPKGRGITHAWHGYSPKRVIKEHKKIGNKSKKWWNSYHIFSVEWTSQKLIYRIDGVVTKTVKRGSAYKPPTDADYFVVISSLTSEFDQKKHKITNKEVANTKTSVDWVKVWATS